MRRFTIVVPYHDGPRRRTVSLLVDALHVLDALAAAARSVEAIRPLLGHAARLPEDGPMVLLSPLGMVRPAAAA